MTIDCQQHTSRSFRHFLVASLLLHVVLCSIVNWLMPQMGRQLPEPPGIIMVSLAEPPQKVGSATPLPAPLPAPVSREIVKPTAQPASVQAAAGPPVSTASPAKRSEPSSEIPAPVPAAAQQGKSGGTPPQKDASTDSVQTARPGQIVPGVHAQPQEMSFGSASGPAFRRQAVPIYPAHAKRRGKTGTVLLRLSISETGQMTHIELLEDPGNGFAEAAVEAVSSSSFTPARHNGKPIAVRATLPIRFTLH